MRGGATLTILIVLAGVALPAAADLSMSARLEQIRVDLEELRFEKALSSIEAVVADPRLTRADRISLLILRSQAHVSYGDLDGAERDYRELLMLRPAYVPEDSLTPPKAIARFTWSWAAMPGPSP